MKLLFATLCLAASAQTVVLRDAAGKELALVPAFSLGSGRLVIDRAALRGAAVADVSCGARALILGEDRDAGLALLGAPCELPASPDGGTLMKGLTVHTSYHETRVTNVIDSASFGFVYRLHTEKRHPRASAVLRDSSEQPAGWYVTRLVDGQLLSFALPLDRLRAIPRTGLRTPPEWNAAYKPEFEDTFQRGLAYIWIEEFEGAEHYLSKAAGLAPGDARAWFHLGFAQGKRAHTTARARSYRQALALDPDLAEAHFNLALASLMSGHADAALPHLADLFRLCSPLAERLAGFLDLIHVDAAPEQR